MDKKRDQANSVEIREDLLEALFGEEDFADDDFCEDYLAASKVDSGELVLEFEAHLQAEAQRLSSKGDKDLHAVNDVLYAIQSSKGVPKKDKNKSVNNWTGQKGRVKKASDYWTNPSVLALAGSGNPIQVITDKARSLILEFMEVQTISPPIDPFALAEYRDTAVIPREDVRDARTRPTSGGKLVIEFNPNRSQGRVRYSICHEITHTLFPDCRERVRNRATHEEMETDEWQLEMLCNIGAAELLMPIGTFPELHEESLSIENLKKLQKKYQVSTEALLLRVAKLTGIQCGIFSASTREGASSYRVDYMIPSQSWPVPITSGFALPKSSIVRNCTAIGYSDSGHEQWLPSLGEFQIECIGIPPYPNQVYPRVMGVIKPPSQSNVSVNRIHYVRGDVTKPRGEGPKIIVQVVNDKTPRWGAGFALVVWKKWPFVQEAFERWVNGDKNNLSLGNAQLTKIDETTALMNMICQHGYGPSPKPRIRYSALKICLTKLADLAKQREASIHMPRIGSGQAGGNWEIIEELIEDILCKQGLKVYVYTLPNAVVPEDPQGRLKFE